MYITTCFYYHFFFLTKRTLRCQKCQPVSSTSWATGADRQVQISSAALRFVFTNIFRSSPRGEGTALASSHSFALRYLSLLKPAMSGMLPDLDVSAHKGTGPEIPTAPIITRSILSLAPELIFIITDEVRSAPPSKAKSDLFPDRHSGSRIPASDMQGTRTLAEIARLSYTEHQGHEEQPATGRHKATSVGHRTMPGFLGGADASHWTTGARVRSRLQGPNVEIR